MLKLVMNADDFGYTEGINYGIIEAYQRGIVRSTTIMTNMPGFEHAVRLAKANPGLGIGVHLTITTGTPLLRTHKTILNEKGEFIKVKDALKQGVKLDLQEIEDEWFAQIQKLYAAGIQPTHIDSHHHSHGEEALLPIAAKIANYYDLPIRMVEAADRKKVDVHQYGIEAFSVDFFDDTATLEQLLTIIQHAIDAKYDSLEIMCHPAFIDQTILSNSSYNVPRAKELQVLTTPGLENHLRSMGVELANFATV